MQLTEKQQIAKDGLMEYLTGPGYGYMLLYGFAGTGKTVTISNTLEDYISNYGGRVAMTAPVNKAVKVLQRTLSLEADYQTIHSLFGLRPDVNSHTGEMEFKPTGINKVDRYDVLVVDESSMLNQELFEMIVAAGKKVIFVGDHKQLRPVGNENTVAAPFRKDVRDHYSIKALGLLDIIRQGSDSGIIPLSAQIRKGYLPIENFVSKYSDLNRGPLDLTIFDTEEYKGDPDYCKVIGYTNTKVNATNSLIRDHIYGNPKSKIVPGERLVINKPVIDGGDILYTTNDEIQVENYDIVTLPYNDQSFKIYACLLRDGNLVNILHEDSESDYDAYVEAFRQLALSTKNKMYWKQMYKFMECFTDVSYNYAITCHKAQGSTYQHTFLCERDLSSCWDKNDKQALWYTGVTRAAKTITFIP